MNAPLGVMIANNPVSICMGLILVHAQRDMN